MQSFMSDSLKFNRGPIHNSPLLTFLKVSIPKIENMNKHDNTQYARHCFHNQLSPNPANLRESVTRSVDINIRRPRYTGSHRDLL